MKKSNLIIVFFTTLTILAQAQDQKPSGVWSQNGQQTVNNKNVYYATPKEWLAFLCDTVIPSGIKTFNGAVVNGKRIQHDRAFFEAHVDQLVSDAKLQLNAQLDSINIDSKGTLSSGTPTVDGLRQYLESNVEAVYVSFNLKTGEKVFLHGEAGDFSSGAFVAHSEADGWYYVLTVRSANGDKKYLLARVSCSNSVTLKETFWLITGKAVIASPKSENETEETGTDPKPSAKKPKIKINGTEVETDAAGNININVYGGDASFHDNKISGGASNNNVDGSGTGTGTGTNGRDGQNGRDGRNGVDGQNGQDVPYPGNSGVVQQDRYDVYGGVHHDRSAEYFASLPSSNPNCGRGVLGGLVDWLFGSRGCTGYALYNNGQYCVGGNYNNGYFQPDYNQCYQTNGSGWWSQMSGVQSGYFTGSQYSFCGGYCNNSWQSPGSSCFGNSNNTYVNHTTVNNTYNTTVQNTPRPKAGGLDMGGTIGAQPQTASGRPDMGYTIPGRTASTNTNNGNTGNGNQGGPNSGGTTGGQRSMRMTGGQSSPQNMRMTNPQGSQYAQRQPMNGQQQMRNQQQPYRQQMPQQRQQMPQQQMQRQGQQMPQQMAMNRAPMGGGQQMSHGGGGGMMRGRH
jgi:hypothetical protein